MSFFSPCTPSESQRRNRLLDAGFNKAFDRTKTRSPKWRLKRKSERKERKEVRQSKEKDSHEKAVKTEHLS